MSKRTRPVIFLMLILLLAFALPALSEGVQTGSVMRTAKQANLRKKPDTSSDLVERLSPYSQVMVLDVIQSGKDQWAQVQVQKSKRRGYILTSLLEPLPTPTPTPTPSPVPTPTPVPTPSPTPTPDYTHVSFDETDPAVLRTSKDCNLRKDADRNSMILEKLPPHSIIRVLQQGEGWSLIKVKRSGRFGYIMNDLLEPIPTPTPTPTPSPVPTPTPVPTPSPTPVPSNPQELSQIEEHFETPMLLRTAVNTNIRQMPNGTRIASLDSHTKLNAVGRVYWEGTSWLHIQSGKNNPEGYIAEELLEQIRPTVTVEVSADEVREHYQSFSFDPMADLEDEMPFSYTQEELDKYKTLRYGDNNYDVIRLKERLYELEYYKNADNLGNSLFTRSTGEIVAKFQRDMGLEGTGEADPLTLCTLYDERTPHRQDGPVESNYLTAKSQPMWIQRAEVSQYDFYGSIQLAVRNQTGNNVSSFSIKVIPNSRDGQPMGWESSFAKEIVREYTVKDLSIPPNYTYSDFETNIEADWEYTWPHHFVVAYKTYFSGAQIAISRYKAGGRTFVVDDDQLVWVSVGAGTGDLLQHVLPIEVTPEERNFASGWDLGMVTHYVWPAYREYYSLPQGAWVESVALNSPAEDAGLEPGDVVIGIGNVTILGDASLRQARGRMQPGDIAELYYWRAGHYYRTELVRPAN